MWAHTVDVFRVLDAVGGEGRTRETRRAHETSSSDRNQGRHARLQTPRAHEVHSLGQTVQFPGRRSRRVPIGRRLHGNHVRGEHAHAQPASDQPPRDEIAHEPHRPRTITGGLARLRRHGHAPEIPGRPRAKPSSPRRRSSEPDTRGTPSPVRCRTAPPTDRGTRAGPTRADRAPRRSTATRAGPFRETPAYARIRAAIRERTCPA